MCECVCMSLTMYLFIVCYLPLTQSMGIVVQFNKFYSILLTFTTFMATCSDLWRDQTCHNLPQMATSCKDEILVKIFVWLNTYLAIKYANMCLNSYDT